MRWSLAQSGGSALLCTRGSAVREAIDLRGATIPPHPLYCPDRNPTGLAFSKPKTAFRGLGGPVRRATAHDHRLGARGYFSE